MCGPVLIDPHPRIPDRRLLAYREVDGRASALTAPAHARKRDLRAQLIHVRDAIDQEELERSPFLWRQSAVRLLRHEALILALR